VCRYMYYARFAFEMKREEGSYSVFPDEKPRRVKP